MNPAQRHGLRASEFLDQPRHGWPSRGVGRRPTEVHKVLGRRMGAKECEGVGCLSKEVLYVLPRGVIPVGSMSQIVPAPRWPVPG